MPRFSRQQYDWFFHEADVTGKGHLSLSDLGNVLAHFSYSIDGATLKRVFREVDLNGDGSISYEEYMYAMDQPPSSTGISTVDPDPGDSCDNDIIELDVIKPTHTQELNSEPRPKFEGQHDEDENEAEVNVFVVDQLDAKVKHSDVMNGEELGNNHVLESVNNHLCSSSSSSDGEGEEIEIVEIENHIDLDKETETELDEINGINNNNNNMHDAEQQNGETDLEPSVSDIEDKINGNIDNHCDINGKDSDSESDSSHSSSKINRDTNSHEIEFEELLNVNGKSPLEVYLDLRQEAKGTVKDKQQQESKVVEEKEITDWLEPKVIEAQLEGKVTQPKLVTVTVTETRHEVMGSLLRTMFNKHDSGGSGRLTRQELMTLFSELGQSVTDEQMNYILHKEGIAEHNIDYEAFVHISTKDHNIEKTCQKTVTVLQ